MLTLVYLWDLLKIRIRPALSFKTTFNCSILRSLIISQYNFQQIILPDFDISLIIIIIIALFCIVIIYICLYMYTMCICMYVHSLKMLRQVVSAPETQSPPVQSLSAEGRKLYTQTAGVCVLSVARLCSCFYLKVHY